MKQKAEIERQAEELRVKADEMEVLMRRKGNTIGNLVHESVPVSETEVSTWREARPRLLISINPKDDNRVERTWHPDGQTPNGEMTKPLKGVSRTMTEGILSHHEVMYRLGMTDMDRGMSAAMDACGEYLNNASQARKSPVIAVSS